MNQRIFIKDDYDKEFIYLLIEISKFLRTNKLSKQSNIIIKNWCIKLSEPTFNIEWKKNRNLYAIYLLDNILNQNLCHPFDASPKFSHLPILSKSNIKSILSERIKTLDLNNKNIIFEKIEYNGKNIFYYDISFDEKNKSKINISDKNDNERSLDSPNITSPKKLEESINREIINDNRTLSKKIYLKNYLLSPKSELCSRYKNINEQTLYNKCYSSNISFGRLESESGLLSSLIIKNEILIKNLAFQLSNTKRKLEILILEKVI